MEALPSSLTFVAAAFRVQAFIGISLLIYYCWRDRKLMGRWATISFCAPAVWLWFYYFSIIFIDVPTSPITWMMLYFQFGLGWFFLGLATVIGVRRGNP